MLAAAVIGSSPHTRGAPRRRGRRVSCKGIIPAYAGSTTAQNARYGRKSDHPRIRGEHSSVDCPPTAAPGSSPHTRGAHPPAQPSLADDGIIPAYAGSTLRNAYKLMKLEDHPRIRGEHGGWSAVRSASPRIIPAYAGSTPTAAPVSRSREDHPRIRGEHISDGSTARISGGSSPHTRGARTSTLCTR